MALFGKKNKKEVEPKQYIFADSIVYDDQKLNFGQKVTVFIVGFLLGAAVGYIFYQNIIIAIIAGAIAGFIAIPAWTKRTIRKRKEKLSMQFRDLLESLSTSIGAGNTIPMAFADAREDIANQYSDSCDMVKEIDNIIGGMAMNINIEELLLDFGERSGISDIMSFAVVFETCYRKGGNIQEVIKNTHRVLSDKMAVEMEIKTMVTSSKTESNAMLIMPIIIVFIMNNMGSGFSSSGGFTDFMVKTVAIIMFVVAYLISKKLTEIKL